MSLSNPAWISTPKVKNLLHSLYEDAVKNDPRVHQEAAKSGATDERSLEYYLARQKAYMPVAPEFGNLLYSLGRYSQAKTIVEFGLSFGVSTIFLASALKDNGRGGKVITTEFAPEKAERAKRNLAEAGLLDWVEVRVGNALETLKSDLPGEIDLILLDGAKLLYLDVLKILEPKIRRGGVIASDNTDMDGLESFLQYIRTPANGYTSSAIATSVLGSYKAHEVSIRN